MTDTTSRLASGTDEQDDYRAGYAAGVREISAEWVRAIDAGADPGHPSEWAMPFSPMAAGDPTARTGAYTEGFAYGAAAKFRELDRGRPSRFVILDELNAEPVFPPADPFTELES